MAHASGYYIYDGPTELTAPPYTDGNDPPYTTAQLACEHINYRYFVNYKSIVSITAITHKTLGQRCEFVFITNGNMQDTWLGLSWLLQ